MAEIKAGPVIPADVDPATAKVAIGGYVCRPEPVPFHDESPVTTLKVRNTGDRPVQVGSHFHFFEVNRALEFDRAAAQTLERKPRFAASATAAFFRASPFLPAVGPSTRLLKP